MCPTVIPWLMLAQMHVHMCKLLPHQIMGAEIFKSLVWFMLLPWLPMISHGVHAQSTDGTM